MSLRAEGLRFAYPGAAPVLDGVDLHVDKGRVLALLGPSGCGKSTLLRVLSGLLAAQAGTVLLDRRDVTAVPPHARRIGMLFQEPALFPHLDAAGNVAFALRMQGVGRAERGIEAHAWLARVGLEDVAASDVDSLSGGQRQRLALARTLAARPAAVLLDEPMSALDTALRIELGRAVKGILADAAVPAVWVTHDEDEARRIGDEVRVMRDGRLAPVDEAAPKSH